jgi:hypothetical protein
MMPDTKSNSIRTAQLEFLMLLLPFAAAFTVILLGLCIAAIVSLATTGALFGWVPAGSIPLWASIVMWMAACLI